MEIEDLDAAGAARCLLWRDPPSGLFAVLVIDDLTLGPGAGGVRTRCYPNLAAAMREASALAQAMTRKCALAGLDAGGAKVVVIDHPVAAHRGRRRGRTSTSARSSSAGSTTLAPSSPASAVARAASRSASDSTAPASCSARAAAAPITPQPCTATRSPARLRPRVAAQAAMQASSPRAVASARPRSSTCTKGQVLAIAARSAAVVPRSPAVRNPPPRSTCWPRARSAG